MFLNYKWKSVRKNKNFNLGLWSEAPQLMTVNRCNNLLSIQSYYSTVNTGFWTQFYTFTHDTSHCGFSLEKTPDPVTAIQTGLTFILFCLFVLTSRLHFCIWIVSAVYTHYDSLVPWFCSLSLWGGCFSRRSFNSFTHYYSWRIVSLMENFSPVYVLLDNYKAHITAEKTVLLAHTYQRHLWGRTAPWRRTGN